MVGAEGNGRDPISSICDPPRYCPDVGANAKGGEVCKGNVAYPEVFGLPTTAIEEKLNAQLAPGEVIAPNPCDHATEASGDYGIGYNKHGVLSLRLTWGTLDSQAAHPSSEARTITVILRDGAPVHLFGDVLQQGTEAALQTALASQIESAAGGDRDAKEILAGALAPPYDDFLLEDRDVRIFALARLPYAYHGVAADGFSVAYARLTPSHGPAAVVVAP
jgi:hypothetical protein